MNRLRTLWDSLRSSLWFVPALIVAGAFVLAMLMIDLDSSGDWSPFAVRWPTMFGGGAEGCRALLAAIASSMITVAGVTFSMTVVAMTLASSQYTSRILRNFMRDRANQTVLGVFVGVFAYSLVVLRSIRSGDEGSFVPGLAVLGALVLAFVAIGFLIFFIHHIATSIQATSIIEAAARETFAAVDRLFPEGVGQAATSSSSDEPAAAWTSARWITIPARRTGYIQGVDANALLQLAEKQGTTLRMAKGIGEFVVEHTPLASVAGTPFDEEDTAAVNAAFAIGRFRTMTQDAGFGIRQIVDIALKALSPGINDTTTAICCLDYLEAVLARLVTRQIEAPHREDTAGNVRLIARGQTFVGMLTESLDQIRGSGEGNVAILLRMLALLTGLMGRATDARRRQAILQHADWVCEAASRSLRSPHDAAAVQRARELMASL